MNSNQLHKRMRAIRGVAAIVLLALLIVQLGAAQVTAHPNTDQHFYQFGGPYLQQYFTGDNGGRYPSCAGAFINNGWVSVDGGCWGGDGGVGIQMNPSVSGFPLPASLYVSSVTIYLNGQFSGVMYINDQGGSGIAGVSTLTPSPTPLPGTPIRPSDMYTTYTVTLNSIMNTNDFHIYFEEDQACYWAAVPPIDPRNPFSNASTNCPFITGVEVQWIDPTVTPGGASSPIPSSTFLPTNPPSSTFLPTDTPLPSETATVINTVVSGPLATIQSLENCNGDPFAPCGTMPFALVYLPTIDLPSPTAFPTVPTNTPIPLTVTPSPTLTPTINGSVTATFTPSNTPIATIPFDAGAELETSVSSGFATLAPLGQDNNYTLNGTPEGLMSIAQQFGGIAGQSLGFINALQLTQLGTAGNILSLLFLALIFVVIVEVITVVLPLILAFVRFILQAIAALKPF